MLLKSIEIFDFKSIKKEYIDIKSYQLCLVGINESGKSNILQAISYLNIEREMDSSLLTKGSSRDGLPLITCVFEINSRKHASLLELFATYTTMNATRNETEKTFYIQFKRWGNGFSNISLEIFSHSYSDKIVLSDTLKEKNKKSEFLDAFFQYHFPVIEVFENEDLFLEPASPQDLLGEDRKFETFRRLLVLGGCRDFNRLMNEDEHIYAITVRNIERKINKIFREHYHQDKTIELSLTTGRNNKLILLINDATGQSYKLSERSPGLRYYFSFLVNKLFYNDFFANRSIVFLLDEPGTNLHPKGAKDLLKTFSEIAKKNLLIYTTHNPFLTMRENLDSLLFVNKTIEDGTRINHKPYLNRYQVLRKELGILLNDSFLLGDINLLVEGATEKYALHILFSENIHNNLEWLNIYNVDGVTKMSETINFLGPQNLNQCGVVLLDSDSEAKKEKGKKSFSKIVNEKKWAVVEINDVFGQDNKLRTFEDLFPQGLYIQAFNLYCKKLNEIGIFDIAYVDYVTEERAIATPIIDVLSDHYLSFFAEEKRNYQSITKQDVIRNLFAVLNKEDIKAKKIALEKVNALVNLIHKKITSIDQHDN